MKFQILLLLCSIIGMVFASECQICCYEIEIDKLVWTNCGHKFCAKCLTEWKLTKDTCPECRVDLNLLSPLIENIKANDVSGAKFIMENKTNSVNQVNEENETPLMVTVKTGNEEIFNLLMQNNVNLNPEDKAKLICIAMENNHEKLACAMVQMFGFQNRYPTIMHQLKLRNIFLKAIVHGQAEVSRLLLDTHTELIYLNENFLEIALARKNFAMAKLLIEKGLNFREEIETYTAKNIQKFLDCVTEEGGDYSLLRLLFQTEKEFMNTFPLLGFGILKNNLTLVKILIENGQDVRKRDINGVTPVNFAICRAKGNTRIEIIDMLIKQNYESLYEKDDDETFSLTYAVISQQEHIVSYFLEHVSHLLSPGHINQALQKLNMSTKNIKHLFCKYQAESLVYAIYENKIEKVKQILKNNPDAIYQRMCVDFTPLMLAIGQGNENMVALLLEQKYLNLKETAVSAVGALKGFTALMFASMAGHLSILKKIMKKDISTFSQICENGKNNALSIAASAKHLNVINYFVNNKSEFITHKMLEHARKVDSTVEIKNKLMQCKSIFEIIQNNNEKSEKRIKHILSKNPYAINETNENDETVLDVSKNCDDENIRNLIFELNLSVIN